MSRVFIAHEAALGRDVVVKLLSPELAHGISAERFTREIHVAAALQEPHIVPVLTAGITGDGLPYYTMPWVAGESLRARIAAGSLSRAEALSILHDVAQALACAHEHGIVHRDIKPENVLISGRTAVVTDFGIARAVEGARSADAAPLTATGVSLGTPAYMAPEQAAGDVVDQRADVYAWGVMAYELLGGAHPFADRSTLQQMIAAQITESPRPLDEGAVGAVLSALVMRCLAKAPAERPSSGLELVRVLDEVIAAPRTANASRHARWVRPLWAAGGLSIVVLAAALFTQMRHRTSGARTLAVLAFENSNRDTSFDYLVEGLGDELRGRLAGTPGLAVKGRASSAQFVGRADPRDVGKRLGVTAVLTGAVRRSGDQVRITVELDDAGSADALWSRTYDRDVHALESVRDTMAADVVGALGLASDASRAPGAGESGTSNFDAYDLFLQGQHAFSRFEFARAARLYADAVQHDSSFARAWASLTIALASAPRDGATPSDSALTAARASLKHALAVAPELPMVRVAEASVQVAAFQFEQAATVLADVIRRDPQNVLAHEQYVAALGDLGRIDDVLQVVEQLRRIDPLNPFVAMARQYAFTAAHRFQEVVDIGRHALEAAPGQPVLLHNTGVAYLFLGQADSAVAMQEAIWRVDSRAAAATAANLALAYAAAGRWADVDRIETRSRRGPPGNSPDFTDALFDIANGRYDSAMRHVERGVAARQPMFVTAWLSCDPQFDALRRDARFVRIAASLGARMCPPLERWPIGVRPQGR
jgi:eukaryotic-like serine/threonine-protein kinase